MATEILEAAMRRDQARAAAFRNASGRLGATGRHEMGVDLQAVMNAVAQEGREVLSEDAKGYWDDQKRLYPWISRGSDTTQGNVRVLKNRHGRVKERIVFDGHGGRRVIKGDV